MTLENAVSRYSQEKKSYEKLAQEVSESIRFLAHLGGVPCSVHGRAKDVLSFAAKARRKNYDDPWSQITDKAGVRVVVDHCGNIDRILEIIGNNFNILREEDDRNSEQDVDRLNYPKVHVQILHKLSDNNLSENRECEIQVRSEAQDLWSRMSHSWMYKPSVRLPQIVRRSLYRLLVLVELYDSAVAQAIGGYLSRKDEEANRLFIHVEQIYKYFSNSSYDLDNSEIYWPHLFKIINEDVDAYAQRLTEFVFKNKEKLESIYRGNPEIIEHLGINNVHMVTQPESIVIFEMIERCKWKLRNEWEKEFDDEIVTRLADAWGETYE